MKQYLLLFLLIPALANATTYDYTTTSTATGGLLLQSFGGSPSEGRTIVGTMELSIEDGVDATHMLYHVSGSFDVGGTFSGQPPFFDLTTFAFDFTGNILLLPNNPPDPPRDGLETFFDPGNGEFASIFGTDRKMFVDGGPETQADNDRLNGILGGTGIMQLNVHSVSTSTIDGILELNVTANIRFDGPQGSAVPEPATLLLSLLGLPVVRKTRNA